MSRPAPSLQKRLRGQFLLLGVGPVVAVFAAAWALLVPVLAQQAEARNSELALAVRDQVELQLDLRLGAAAQLAERLRNDPPAPGALQLALQALMERDPYLQAAYVTDGRGQVVDAALPANSGRFVEDVVGLDLSAQPYFDKARRSGEPVWSDTFLSTLTGQVAVALALPAGEQTVLLELSLAALSGLLVDMAQPGSSQVAVVDRVGRVIAHPDARRALQRESLSGLPLVRRALAGTAGSARTERDGVPQLAHAVSVMPVGWAVLVSQPVSAVMAPLLRLGGAVLGVLAATVLVAVGVGWRMARRTGQEVTQLADGAQRAVSNGGIPPELSFSTREFNAVWTRLRDLFQQLHQRDSLTRAVQQDLQAVLDAATQVAIVAMDREGGVTVFNIGAQRMLGWRSDEVVGRVSPTAWHDETEVAARAQVLSRKYGQPVSGVEALISEARHGGYEVRDWVFVRRDGGRLDVSLAMTAMRTPEGALKGFLGVAIDITERRRAAALELARKTAELANQAKSEFLSKMSHELRTPLNAVLGFAQLIEAEQAKRPPAEHDEHVRHIQRAGWHLVRLIDDVLDLARIESGRLAVTIGAVELGPVLAQAEQMVQPQLRQFGVSLRVAMAHGPAGAGLCVAADATRLSQVLVNLLSNAAKYNRPQGEVELTCRRDGAVVRLVVSDTGIGMSEAQLARLYEPFNRLGQERGRREGTGIGLVITRHLVELMHGQIDVHSEPGVGTRFVITLPVAGEAAPAEGVEPALGGPAADTAATGRVVCIEDNEINALLVRAALRQRPRIDLQVFGLASTGLDAIRAAPPDLILLDMHLPDASGEQVLASLRADDRLFGIPVVVISADATQARIEEMLRQGAQAYLTKPLDLAEALGVIDRLLDAGAAPAGVERLPG
jgi:PAS domain S-box-containing protein